MLSPQSDLFISRHRTELTHHDCRTHGRRHVHIGPFWPRACQLHVRPRDNGCACCLTKMPWRNHDYHAKRVHEPSIHIKGTLGVHWHAWKHGLSASVLFAVDGPYACTVSVAGMLSGEGASSTMYNVTRGYYVRTIVYVLPTVYAGQGSAPQARSGSIYMCDVRKVKIRTPPRNSTTLLYHTAGTFYHVVQYKHETKHLLIHTSSSLSKPLSRERVSPQQKGTTRDVGKERAVPLSPVATTKQFPNFLSH
jgi:hypothetical protein